MPSSNGSEPNKAQLYGEWLKGQEWKRSLQKSVSHKALDIAEGEEVNLSVNKSTGIGTMGAIGVALASSLGTAILGGAMLLKGNGQAPPQTAPTVPAAQEIELRWEFDGKTMKFTPVK